MKQINHQDTYQIGDPDNELRLSIIYGDGQTGSSDVEVNGVLIASGTLDEVLLGDAGDIVTNGGTVIARSIITQTNASSEHFSVVHDLEGGTATQRLLVADQFDQGTSASVTETITVSK
jgi:hypothetical protein